MKEGIYLREEELDLNAYYVKTFLWMFLGLLVTVVTSVITLYFGKAFITPTILGIITIITMVIVFIFSFCYDRVSSQTAACMYFGLAILYGIELSSIFYVYNLGTIAICFGISAILFGVMALYGYVTKKDLYKWSFFLSVALIACLIALIVNMFVGSTLLETIICIAVILVVMFVTAYDINSAKDTNLRSLNNSHIFFALSLYLDFLTIFLYLLRLFGIKVDNKK